MAQQSTPFTPAVIFLRRDGPTAPRTSNRTRRINAVVCTLHLSIASPRMHSLAAMLPIYEAFTKWRLSLNSVLDETPTEIVHTSLKEIVVVTVPSLRGLSTNWGNSSRPHPSASAVNVTDIGCDSIVSFDTNLQTFHCPQASRQSNLEDVEVDVSEYRYSNYWTAFYIQRCIYITYAL